MKSFAKFDEFIRIFDIVTRVQFAPNDRSLLATCGRDGILAICQVLPTPATIIYRLKGHTAAINGLFSHFFLF